MEANDMKAMREALECVLDDYADDSPIAEMIRAALKNPPRNCDVGTAEEQLKRKRAYCKGQYCRICPFYGNDSLLCAFRWAQTTYKEGDDR